MQNETNSQNPQEENTMVYVVGAIIVVAIIIAGVMLWPKPKKQTTEAPSASPTVESKPITKPPLTKLTCENQWYNPVVGIPKFYLSAQGGDIKEGEKIDCTFALIRDGKQIATALATAPLSPAPERGGSMYTCTTKALENIPQNVEMKMIVNVKNEAGDTASCSGNVTLR